MHCHMTHIHCSKLRTVFPVNVFVIFMYVRVHILLDTDTLLN